MLPSIFGENLFDTLFDRAFERNLFGGRDPLYGRRANHLMKTDIKEVENGYELAVDLPGFQKEDVQLDLRDGYLTISANKSLNRDEKDAEGRFIRQERYAGQCSRSFYVGDVTPEEVSAKYENGVLTLKLPKKAQQALPEQTRIAIE